MDDKLRAAYGMLAVIFVLLLFFSGKHTYRLLTWKPEPEMIEPPTVDSLNQTRHFGFDRLPEPDHSAHDGTDASHDHANHEEVGHDHSAHENKKGSLITILILLGLAVAIVLFRRRLARLLAKVPFFMEFVFAYCVIAELVHIFTLVPILPHLHGGFLFQMLSASVIGKWLVRKTRFGKWLKEASEYCKHIEWPEKDGTNIR